MKEAFYSPCRCGEFKPKESTWDAIILKTPVTQTVCANCGRHKPEAP